VSVLVVIPQRYGPPAVPSVAVECGRCHGPCWLSQRARLAGFDGLLCVVCAMAVVKPGDTIDAAPWVVEDLADAIEAGDL
jgi:hypothetical protein